MPLCYLCISKTTGGGGLACRVLFVNSGESYWQSILWNCGGLKGSQGGKQTLCTDEVGAADVAAKLSRIDSGASQPAIFKRTPGAATGLGGGKGKRNSKGHRQHIKSRGSGLPILTPLRL